MTPRPLQGGARTELDAIAFGASRGGRWRVVSDGPQSRALPGFAGDLGHHERSDRAAAVSRHPTSVLRNAAECQALSIGGCCGLAAWRPRCETSHGDGGRSLAAAVFRAAMVPLGAAFARPQGLCLPRRSSRPEPIGATLQTDAGRQTLSPTFGGAAALRLQKRSRSRGLRTAAEWEARVGLL